MKDSSSQGATPVIVTVKVYIVGDETFTRALPDIVIVFPITGPKLIPGGSPDPLAFVALPLMSNVIGVIAPFSHTI